MRRRGRFVRLCSQLPSPSPSLTQRRKAGCQGRRGWIVANPQLVFPNLFCVHPLTFNSWSFFRSHLTMDTLGVQLYPSHYRAGSGLSPCRTCAHRAHRSKRSPGIKPGLLFAEVYHCSCLLYPCVQQILYVSIQLALRLQELFFQGRGSLIQVSALTDHPLHLLDGGSACDPSDGYEILRA